MRYAFVDEVDELAQDDERIVVLSGDIGNRMFNDYKENHPDRFINCGVAEANMISTAAGLALSGQRPVTYTIASFTTTRCLEQIRIDVCYHDAPVTIIGMGAGLCYPDLGATHHTLEDIAHLGSLPNMTVLCPGDPLEVKAALRAAVQEDGPVYIRLGKKGEPTFHDAEPDFEIGEPSVIRPGSDVALLSVGNMLGATMEAAEILEAEGVDPEVVSFHTVKPLPEDFLDETFSDFDTIVTIEEHGVRGGAGARIAEWKADENRDEADLVRIATPDAFFDGVGDQNYAREELGLNSESISRVVLETLERDTHRKGQAATVLD